MAFGAPLAVLGWVAIEKFGGGFPPCLFRQITSVACAGCGTTRAFHALLAGDWREAFLWNPGSVLFALLAGIFSLLAWVHLVFPRRRYPCLIVIGKGWRVVGIWLILGIVFLNWTYLLLVGRV